uniref:Methionine--tRNA ligase, mitochondrial n=1 Tax=Glossina brevipalpis TaxID=37001 RepID=A0A1A9W7E1_9MUSC
MNMLSQKLNVLNTFFRSYSHNFGGNFYATTPIFYVNGAPHIGHLYSAVIADAICRYQRLLFPEVSEFIRLSTGTDEHGTKIEQAATARKTPVMSYCTKISDMFSEVFHEASVHHCDFIRTTEQRHKEAVNHFWNTLFERNTIYLNQYSGWYCVADETFLTNSQLRLDEQSGVRYSLESGHPVEWTEEENYIFRLSKFQSDILYWLKQGDHVRPAKFEKILLDTLNEPLHDVSISRPVNRVSWALPVPNDPSQTIYVWFDALVNYLTSVGYPDEKYTDFWPPSVQVLGKDILKFHGIYWPAFLIAAGLEPPKQLYVHSHWTVEGQKMSKSKNNVIEPNRAAKMYTMEGLRYFLLREGTAHSDANVRKLEVLCPRGLVCDYCNVKALRILNAELADTLGNLLSRLCSKALNPRQIYPRLHTAQLREILKTDNGRQLSEVLQQFEAKCTQHFNDRNFYMAADVIMSTLHVANRFLEFSRPWELKLKITDVDIDKRVCLPMPQCDENCLKLETILAMTMDTLRVCGIALQPLVPILSTRLLDKLSVPYDQRKWANLNHHFVQVAEGAQEPPLEACLNRTNLILFKRIISKENDTNW